MLLGGHIRVGPDDNLYHSQARRAGNLGLTERTARIREDPGDALATPAEARELLGLPQLASP